MEGQRAGTVEGSRGGQRENPGSEFAGVSYEAEAEEIAARFSIKLAGLRRRLRPWEIPAAVRALREQKQMALVGLRERRAIARLGDRLERQQTRMVSRSQTL